MYAPMFLEYLLQRSLNETTFCSSAAAAATLSATPAALVAVAVTLSATLTPAPAPISLNEALALVGAPSALDDADSACC